MTLNLRLPTWPEIRKYAPMVSATYVIGLQVAKALCAVKWLPWCDNIYSIETLGNLFGIAQYADPAVITAIAGAPALAGQAYKLYCDRQKKKQQAIDPKTLIIQGPGYRG